MFVKNGAEAKQTKNAHKRCPVYSYTYIHHTADKKQRQNQNRHNGYLTQRGRQGSITGDKEVNYKLYLE